MFNASQRHSQTKLLTEKRLEIGQRLLQTFCGDKINFSLRVTQRFLSNEN